MSDFVKATILEELKALKKTYIAVDAYNPFDVLLLPLTATIIVVNLMWSFYVLWMEEPIIIKRALHREETVFKLEPSTDLGRTVIRIGDAVTPIGEMKGSFDDKLTSKIRLMHTKISNVSIRDEVEKADADKAESSEESVWQARESSVMRFVVKPSVVVASNLSIRLPEQRVSQTGSLANESTPERRSKKRSRAGSNSSVGKKKRKRSRTRVLPRRKSTSI